MPRNPEVWKKLPKGATRSSLARLREQFRMIAERAVETELVTFAEVHSDDPRAGAAALVERCNRRLHALRAERERLAALFTLRAALFAKGVRYVAGVDEVGVGPLAGPVVAAAVILPERVELPRLDDSKKLRADQREVLDRLVRDQAIAVAIGEVSVEDVDRLNVYNAALEAMRRAVVALSPVPQHLMVDARRVPGVDMPQTPLVHGDAIDGSIAAASIVAKVYRDKLMSQLDARHPGYGLARHMGYGTAMHLAALERLGPSPIHRRSFAPVARLVRRAAPPALS